MSNFSQFTNKQNLSLLLDVLLDELHINKNNNSLTSNIKMVFESNINPFTSRSNPKLTIMELNKQFLSQVALAVNRLFPNLKQEQNIKRITITNEDALEPYTIEDIHSSRQSDFEKGLERKKMELETYMTPPKPKDLNFSDRSSNEKITSMDSLVAEKMAQRNFEIDRIQSNNYSNSSIDTEKWLTPAETSVKGEKHIQALDNNISLTIQDLHKQMKTVSWEDDTNRDNNNNKTNNNNNIKHIREVFNE